MLDFQGNNDFASLSLKDLLEARDLYHFHLINKANVVGTAVGRYLIRKDDAAKGERTFYNSDVRDDSWPCVIVLVKEWVDERRFGGSEGQVHPYEMVPNSLHLPDGRVVPVCVVTVEREQPAPNLVPDWVWPKSMFGPGFPVVVDRQGTEHTASIGCLVSDGHTVYALTSRHVCGTEGMPLYTMSNSRRVRIGRASSKQVTRLPFSECYPDFPSRRTYVNLDVGLCEIEDTTQWSPRVYGLPPIGEAAELNEANIRLHLINANVVAHGAASGKLEGRIKALFYRYRSVAGFDYVSDFLIAPTNGSGTQPGDSGTVWHLVSKDLLRPIAVEWGGQAFAASGGLQFRFTLATSLASVCKQLDVDVVRDNDVGVRPYWGQTGHYDIATFACDQVKGAKLKKLMRANVKRISFAMGSLDADAIATAITEAKDEKGYVPLADVPDVVWKNLPSKVKGGRDTHPAPPHGSTGPEHPTHYADIDQVVPSKGKTMRQMCLDDDASISVQVWKKCYDELGHAESRSRGCLPFRVWQYFKEMVKAVDDGDIPRFLAAAGTLAHYVGDACQPLHGSMHADGFMDQKVTVVHHERETGEEYTTESNVGAGVHSAYESNMIDRFSAELVTKITNDLQNPQAFPEIKNGKQAAKATIELMERAATKIPPEELIQTYLDAGGKKAVKVYEALWDEWKDETAATMADGARVLAWIWECAWKEGNGNRFDDPDLHAIDYKKLRKLYEDKNFVPSLDLNHIAPEL